MSTDKTREPVAEHGIEYWAKQPASYDGVLGGFGTGSLPRVETLGSRQFLLHIRPDLLTVPSALRPLDAPAPDPNHRTRALDVGAGIGRVTADVLLHFFSDILLLEPVDSLIREAYKRGSDSELDELPARNEDDEGTDPPPARWKGIKEKKKSVTFQQGSLQTFDPAHPRTSSTFIGRVGFSLSDAQADSETGFDVVWCQWCLMYMSDSDLVRFLQASKKSLRDEKSVIVVKENVCREKVVEGVEGGEATVEFDEDDSSVTRSDLRFKEIFAEAGLKIVHEKVQGGLQEGLFTVKMYALR